MSDNFIPLNQSTPVHGMWQGNQGHKSRKYYNNSSYQNGQRRGGHHSNWSNNSRRNISYGSDSNSSFGQDSRSNIDAYLHPSMLEDPWQQLRKHNKYC